MAKIRVERLYADAQSTIGAMWVNGLFHCFTLEDEFRLEKVADETRIPAGTYKILLRDEGGMTKRYASKYPEIHKGMLWLQNVPGFEWVYIHIGNREDHTSGCILVGDQCVSTPGAMAVLDSAKAYERLYRSVAKAAADGELEIEIVDRDQF